MSDLPNILLITSDQHIYDALGCVNPRIQTPALDRLAREGLRCDRAYANNPVCSPSRATILTGLYPSWHGCWTIGVKLPEDAPTINDSLNPLGYRTSLIGKGHFQPLKSTPERPSIESQPTLRDLDFWRDFHGPWYGFQHVEISRNHADESHVGAHYALWMEANGFTEWRDYFCAWPPDPSAPRRRHAWSLPEEQHYSVWTAERTIAQIEEATSRGEPFFCWSSFHDPHPPYLVPEPWASMYDPAEMQPGRATLGEFEHMPPAHRMTQQSSPDYSAFVETPHLNHGYHSQLQDEEELRKDIAVYYGMVSLMDREIGRILAALDRCGAAENTLVVFTTDHGHFLGQHGLNAKGPFHYEEMVRVPFLARFPGRIPAGSTTDALQALIDLPPTFLEAAGAPTPGHMQGVSQWDVWCGRRPAARDHVLVENRHQPTAIHLRTLITPQHKLTLYRGREYGELFDLVQDPAEVRNRWGDPESQPVKARLLEALAQAELAREPLWAPRVANA